uniref:CSON000140 protein n=1 Tax=Culicoides sonorensis TaxID=179676 RepID=A0A336LPC3_CULSO
MDLKETSCDNLDYDYKRLINEFPERVLDWENINNHLFPFAHHLIQESLIDDLKLLTNKIPSALQQLTQYDESVLYSALKFENYDIARYLIQLDPSQTLLFFYGFAKGGQSPLTIACDTFRCPGDVISKLLKNGPTYKRDELKLALYNGVKARNVDAIILLLEHDLSLLNEKYEEESGKHLMHLSFEGKLNQDKIFDYLWQNYRDQIDWSNTLLHSAVAWSELEIVKYCCEELNINIRIKNHDNENPLKAAVYRASLGQWELFCDKISYLTERTFKPPHGNFCFEAVADLFNLTSLHRHIIQDFLATFNDDEPYTGFGEVQPYFICIFLHDKAVVYPEQQTRRREIIHELGNCSKKIMYDLNHDFTSLLNVIRTLQKVPGFTIDSSEFCDYAGIIYYELFLFPPDKVFKDSRFKRRLLDFYTEFNSLGLINFDDIIDINICHILFHKTTQYSDKEMLVNSEIFRTQLQLANSISIRPKGMLSNIYNSNEFRLIQNFLGQNDYNRVCCGKDIMSLKLMCRESCRKAIFNKNVRGKYREVVIKSLGLPKVLVTFLQFKD